MRLQNQPNMKRLSLSNVHAEKVVLEEIFPGVSSLPPVSNKENDHQINHLGVAMFTLR